MIFWMGTKKFVMPLYKGAPQFSIFPMWLAMRLFFFSIKATIEDATENIPAGLTWLDEHRHMLELYSDEQGHTISETGYIRQESQK